MTCNKPCNKSYIVVPYLPSAGFCRRWVGERLRGLDAEEALLAILSQADFREQQHKPTRAIVAGAHGQPPLMLSVPIVGGSSVVKRDKPLSWLISDHGRWQKMHLGALNAAYSATPYYPHLMPDLERIILNAKEGDSFTVFTREIWQLIRDFLHFEALLPDLKRSIQASPERIAAIAKEKSADVNGDITFFEVLFKKGVDALFTLLRRVPCLLLPIAGLLCCLNFSFSAYSQTKVRDLPDAPEYKVKAFDGFQRIVDQYGDTCRLTYIHEIVVYPPMKFKNKKEEEFYWRTVRDVRKTLPYAKLCFSTLCETYEYVSTIPDQKRREAHLKRLEKDIFERYKPVVKKMTKNQGKVMLKLINRETDQSSYHIVKAFLGSFRAGFWQTFGRFFGMNLKAGFHPDKNKEDAMIDRIATLIEQGAL